MKINQYMRWIMISWPKCEYMFKLVIVMPKIEWRFIMRPLVLVQGRTNATHPSRKTCLLGPFMVVKGMNGPSVVLRVFVFFKYWCKCLRNIFNLTQKRPNQSYHAWLFFESYNICHGYQWILKRENNEIKWQCCWCSALQRLLKMFLVLWVFMWYLKLLFSLASFSAFVISSAEVVFRDKSGWWTICGDLCSVCELLCE